MKELDVGEMPLATAEEILEVKRLNQQRVVNFMLKKTVGPITERFTRSMVNVTNVTTILHTVTDHLKKIGVPVPDVHVEKIKGGVRINWRWDDTHHGYQLLRSSDVKGDGRLHLRQRIHHLLTVEMQCELKEEAGIWYITTPEGDKWDMTVPLSEEEARANRALETCPKEKEKRRGPTY